MEKREDEYRTLSIDETEQALDEAADQLPAALFEGLNGGVILKADVVPSPHGKGLYILGNYHYEPYGLGRYITIHYGSMVRVHGRQSVRRQKQALADVLRHELTHHVEGLAGVRDLDYKDELFLEKYKEKPKKSLKNTTKDPKDPRKPRKKEG